MAKLTEEEQTWRRIQRAFRRGTSQYQLLADGDRILVGLSGGKDSLALLALLAEQSRIFRPRIQVEAAHIVMRGMGYASDHAFLRQYAEGYGVPLHIVETTFDAERDPRKSRCFLCSWHRRKALFSLVRELNCNKIALGHHMDDILQTMLMNLTFEGQFGTMRPLMRMDKFDATLIRPLCLTHEGDLRQIAALRQWPSQLKQCPYDKQTSRARIKELFRLMEELNPEARYSMWHSLGL